MAYNQVRQQEPMPYNQMPNQPGMQYPQVPQTPQYPQYPQYPDYPETYRPLVPGYPQDWMTSPDYPGYYQAPIVAPDVGFEEGPPTTTDIGYTPAYLKTQIGRKVKVEFLIGTNMLVDREGTLVDVGINYTIIQETETDDLLLADMYSIKFVRFYY